LKLAAYSKINLGLEILNKRNDGYHELDMITQSISLCDYVTINLKKGQKTEIKCNRDLCFPVQNTVMKAALRFADYINEKFGAEIYIEKNIPIKSGLGGGSADAAAVIFALNKLLKTNFTEPELIEISAQVGSDVSLCLVGGTLRVRGMGEKITHIHPLPPCYILIAVPQFGLSTKEMYDIYDSQSLLSGKKAASNCNSLQKSIESGNIESILVNIFNDFEKITRPNFKRMHVTGSGSAEFIISESLEDASGFKEDIPCANVFVCEPKTTGVEIIEDFRN
jgi:4-diphosphocytidyl-2-C-methyl-D-erythritol kinase